jgi:hypothetical protein
VTRWRRERRDSWAETLCVINFADNVAASGGDGSNALCRRVPISRIKRFAAICE